MANGEVEKQIQEVRGQIRTLKQSKLKDDHPSVPWLVAHAASLITRYKINEDGKTAYQKWKGRRYGRSIAEFGECVMYLTLGSQGVDKFDERWHEGNWLCSKGASHEILIGTPAGVVKARSVRRKPDFETRWNLEQFNEMKGVPWEPIPGSDNIEIKSKVNLEDT